MLEVGGARPRDDALHRSRWDKLGDVGTRFSCGVSRQYRQHNGMFGQGGARKEVEVGRDVLLRAGARLEPPPLLALSNKYQFASVPTRRPADSTTRSAVAEKPLSSTHNGSTELEQRRQGLVQTRPPRHLWPGLAPRRSELRDHRRQAQGQLAWSVSRRFFLPLVACKPTSTSTRTDPSSLASLCADFKVKTNLATELRDVIDMYQKDLDLGRLFEVLLPCFTDILRTGKPSFVSTSGEHVSPSRRAHCNGQS